LFLIFHVHTVGDLFYPRNYAVASILDISIDM